MALFDSVTSFFDTAKQDVDAAGSYVSSFFDNIMGTGVSSQVVNKPEQATPSLTNSLLGGLVSYFTQTPVGQKVTNTATQQKVDTSILGIVKSPVVWVAAGVVVYLLFFRK